MKYAIYFLCIGLAFIHSNGYCQNKLQFQPIGTMAVDSINTNIETAFNDKLANVRVVGLGEVTHGDKTTFAFILKMIQYLVTEQNFRLLTIEGPNSIISPLNDFILSDSTYLPADVDSLVKRAIPGRQSMHSKQMVILVTWLKNYNINHPGKKVSMTGIDIDSKSVAFLFDTYIKPNDPASAKTISEKWEQAKYPLFYKLSDVYNWEVQNRAMINNLNDTIKNKLEWNIRESEITYEYSFSLIDFKKENGHYVTNTIGEKAIIPDDNYFVKNYVDHNYDKNFNRNMQSLDSIREVVMANNVLRLSKDNKAIVWAHNYHVSKPGENNGLVTGDYLNQKLGKQYFVVVTDYSGLATVANFDKGGVKKLPDGSAGNSTARVLKKNYAFTQGIIFSQDLQDLGFTDIAIHGVNANEVGGYSGMPISGFDAYVVFKAIFPIDLLN